MWIYLLIILMCLVFFHISIRYSRSGKLINKIPGPPPLPILGNLLTLNCNIEDLWTVVREITNKYYPITKLWLVTSAMIIIRDPDDVKILLSDKVNINKGYMYKHFEVLAKSGLIASNGNQWRQRRKVVTPAFHQNILKTYMEISIEQTEKFIDFLKVQGDESVQNLIHIFSKLTMAIIFESTMGIGFNNLTEEAEYRESVEEFLGNTAYRMFRPYIQDWMMKFMEVGRRQEVAISRIRSYTNKMINKRREYHENIKYESFRDFVDDKDDSENIAGGRRKRLSILDILLLAEKEGLIDATGVFEEVNTIIAAGYDTTGWGVVYTLMLLAENKEVQELARAEAFRVQDKSGSKITMTEIQQLHYIERCVKEALRLFPTGPSIVRSITKDIQLKNHLVPAGSDIAVPIYDIHRDPNIWPDPDKFDPDRFLSEEVKKRHPFADLTFSAGPRNCIGQKLAINELKSMIAHILYNFYLEPVDFTKDLKFMVHAVLQATTKPHVKFIKINRK